MTLLLSVFLFLLGTVLASFTTVVAERIYTGQSFMQGRSRCNSCRRTLTFIDLVPVFSLLSSGGKCRTCHARIPLIYSLFEAALGIVFVLAYISLGLTVQLVVFIATSVTLLFIVIYDLRHTVVTWGSSFTLVGLSLLFAFLHTPSFHVLFMNTLVAFGIGSFFFLMHILSRGRWMGLGDAPVAFGLSLLVGSAALTGFLYSFWIGAAIGILILLIRRAGPTMGIEIPFVPFLALGYLLSFFTHLFTTWTPLF